MHFLCHFFQAAWSLKTYGDSGPHTPLENCWVFQEQKLVWVENGTCWRCNENSYFFLKKKWPQITFSQILHINDGKDTIFETYQVPKSLIFLNIYASFLSDFQTPWKRKKQGSKSWFSVKVIKIDVGNSLTDGMSKKNTYKPVHKKPDVLFWIPSISRYFDYHWESVRDILQLWRESLAWHLVKTVIKRLKKKLQQDIHRPMIFD